MLEKQFRKMLGKDLTKEEEEDYINMFKRYPHLFITDYSMIKGVDVIQHHIDLKPDAKPIAQKLRRLVVLQQEALLTEVNKLLKASFIYPVSNSEWVSPAVVIPKKNVIEHWIVQRVEEGLQRFYQYGGQLNPNKCHVAKKEVVLLGHVISQEGIKVDPSRVQAFLDLLPPNSARQVITFDKRILTKELGHDQQVPHDVDTFQKEMQDVVGLMKNLGVHMMGGGRGQGYGYGHGYGSNESFGGGRGRAEEKGKTKVVNIIRLDKGKDDVDAMVMPVGKRTTRERDTSYAGPNHKRGKQAKTCTCREKKKRKPRRHYNTSNFPLGEGQPNDNLRADLVGRKADVTFGQLMEMCLRLKRQWKRMVNPMKNEPTKGSVRGLSLNELLHICPTIDGGHKRKCIGEAYIDGGAQVCVITQSCVTKLGLHMTKNLGFCIKLANQSRVRCLGIIKDMEVEVLDVKAPVNFHVMPAGIGAFPLILGRPWLQTTKAIQDWGHGTIILYNRSGDKKRFDMATKQSLDADFHEDDDDEEYSSSEQDDGEESSELDANSDDNEEVSSLFLEEEKGQKQATLCFMENEDTSGPYEKIEGLMQPKGQLNVKEELIQKMLCPDLTSHEKGEYLHMLQQFPNFFITSYEEIRGFKEEEFNMPIKEGAQPVCQKLRRMGQVQLNALKQEVDKLLKAGFIYPNLTGGLARWVLLLQEFEFEVIHRSGAQHAVADYLSRLDSGEPPTGIADEFLDASLFLTGAVADEARLEQSTWRISSIPWTWYEEMFHFLDSGDMPAFLSHHQQRRMAICSRNFEIIMGKLYYRTVADVLLRCVLPQ
ncbi:hypothetical protein L7F22_020486 [Adiantum nelumboides]|nr:hypothetical protein [Adiantum nelumboides]